MNTVSNLSYVRFTVSTMGHVLSGSFYRREEHTSIYQFLPNLPSLSKGKREKD